MENTQTAKDERSAIDEAKRDALLEFIDDLEAANRFKAYLLGAGVEVPSEVLEGLAELTGELSPPELAVSEISSAADKIFDAPYAQAAPASTYETAPAEARAASVDEEMKRRSNRPTGGQS